MLHTAQLNRPSRLLWTTALCLVLLSVLTSTFAAPIPESADHTTSLAARGDEDLYKVEWYDNGHDGKKTTTWYKKNSEITQAEYEKYLNYNYKNKDR